MRSILPLSFLLLALAAAACRSTSRPSFFGGDVILRVSVAPAANLNSPVPVELVVAYDKKVLDELLAMSAREWFDGREQYLRDHPKGFSAWRWEWVPGQVIERQRFSFGVGARGGVVYADYLTAGKHRARFDPHRNLWIKLEDEGFSVEAFE